MLNLAHPAYAGCVSAGLVYWDVFKTAKLDSFKPKAVAAGDGEGAARAQGGSTKSNRVQHTTHSAGKMPASFTSNSKKEQKMLAYVRDFQRVFQELYPHRYEPAVVSLLCLGSGCKDCSSM
jgi:hypothetical protein